MWFQHYIAPNVTRPLKKVKFNLPLLKHGFDVGPDPAFNSDADPDLASQEIRIRIRILQTVYTWKHLISYFFKTRILFVDSRSSSDNSLFVDNHLLENPLFVDHRLLRTLCLLITIYWDYLSVDNNMLKTLCLLTSIYRENSLCIV